MNSALCGGGGVRVNAASVSALHVCTVLCVHMRLQAMDLFFPSSSGWVWERVCVCVCV